jgi:tetratricopeptide (TPR) repeat protein
MPSVDFSRSVSANLGYWLNSSRDLEDKALHRLDEERHNLYRAVGFGLGLESSHCDASQLILQIYPLIERRGYWRRWIPLLEKAVKGCGYADTALTVHLLDRLGQCYRLNRQWEKSLARHHREKELAKDIGDQKLLAKACLNLSQTYWSLRQYDQAVRYGKLAMTGFTEYGSDTDQLGATTSNLGLIALSQGELKTAETWLLQAIDTYRSINKPALLARSLMNLTITLQRDGRNEEALPLCQEAVEILDATDHELDKVRVGITLGTLYMKLNRLHEAEEVYKRANSPALRRIGDTYLMAVLANNLGSVYYEMERLEEAERAYNDGIILWRRCGGRLMLANTLGSMAETKLARDCPEEAFPYLDETIAITMEFPDDVWGREMLAKYTKMREEL